MAEPRGLDMRPDLRIRYALERRALLVDRLRIGCWLALFLVPVFAALDFILHPHVLVRFALIRVGMLAFAGGVLLALRTNRGRSLVGLLSFLTLFELGFGIVVMTTFIGGGSSPYYAGVNLVMLGAAVLLPWEATISVGFVGLLIGSYLAVCLYWAGVPDPTIFAANLFFLCSTGLITVLSHSTGAIAGRREFLQRVALEEAGRHRDEFLANITHELRTPLAAILGFAEMLDEHMVQAGEAERGWLRRIRENAATLYRLIVQLLDFSKIEAGALQLEREPVDLAAIVAKVAANLRAIAGEDGCDVRVRLSADAPLVVGDAARIEEIVTNLAANALKFSEGRPVTLSLQPSTISPVAGWQRLVPDPGPDADAGAWAEIAVEDGGVGIETGDLSRLFVAFQQLDGSSTRRQGGTGLGLAISARLAQAMRGHIAVRSAPGAGSTFAVLLPVIPYETDEATPDHHPTPLSPADTHAAAQ